MLCAAIAWLRQVSRSMHIPPVGTLRSRQSARALQALSADILIRPHRVALLGQHICQVGTALLRVGAVKTQLLLAVCHLLLRRACLAPSTHLPLPCLECMAKANVGTGQQ